MRIYRRRGYLRVYLPLSEVLDTPSHIQGDDVHKQGNQNEK